MADQLIAGRFRLQERIGAGGKGVVSRATDEQLGRVVALKRALPGAGERDLARLKDEARIAAALHHPHVVTLFDVVQDGADHWLVLEYVPSRSLAEILEDEGSLPPRRAARIGAQIADALRAVHAHGVVHGDVKPGNVLVTEDDTAKLTDFGISHVIGAAVTLTDTGLVSGTPAYVAPEVARHDKPTSASDVFSLGATLFAAVEGESPYGSTGNARAMLHRASRGKISSPGKAGELAPVLKALLRPEPEDRPDAAEALRMLRAVLGEPAPEKSTVDRPRRGVLVAAVGLVIAIVAALVYFWGGSGRVLGAGDQRTADPCALLDPAALKGFGTATLVEDRGVFSRCDLDVRMFDGIKVDVQLRLEDALPPGLNPPGTYEERGDVGIARESYTGTLCVHTIVLADRNRVVIGVERSKRGAANLCALADAVSGHAISVLERQGGLPRRTTPFAPNSLATVGACGLLDAEALNRVPGIDPRRPDTAFADWECRWRNSEPTIGVTVIFDRATPLAADDGQLVRIGGREAYFKQEEGEDDDTCAIRVPHRAYGKRIELLSIRVSGSQPLAQRCATAVELARSATAKLPPA
ncbi:serine/threonine protein kinase [Allokutzneria sp. A3M-2-11 16]|uniref:serine/threonine-protein kinase n=1 Tax=Allokutzneria sp. A3M-2-11 16 TaxID=2962043 RepID=UPI0020B8F50E|nr:serine/threonine-protein kinase [Allokutzneria sp. A3M-2-11 16]MCP3798689.1 serine/threonine protein kinase [Allokutzneria sp. A3M-2-11 16]